MRLKIGILCVLLGSLGWALSTGPTAQGQSQSLPPRPIPTQGADIAAAGTNPSPVSPFHETAAPPPPKGDPTPPRFACPQTGRAARTESRRGERRRSRRQEDLQRPWPAGGHSRGQPSAADQPGDDVAAGQRALAGHRHRRPRGAGRGRRPGRGQRAVAAQPRHGRRLRSPRRHPAERRRNRHHPEPGRLVPRRPAPGDLLVE